MRYVTRFSRHLALLVALAIIGAAGAALAACGGGDDGDGGSGAAAQQIASYLYVRQPLADWDPAVESGDGAIVLMNVYETLLRYEPSDESFTPVLAESYEASEDGMTWTFTIREGVTFHDGTTLDAEDVKFSVERHINLGKGLSYIWAPVETVEAPDTTTVVFNLKYPAPMDLIVSSGYSAYIMSKEGVESHPEGWLTEGNEVGSGPYMLKSWKMDQEVVLEKYPDYWGGWEGEHFDTVLIKKVAEAATKRQMVESGEADVVIELPYEDYEALASNPELEVVTSASFKNLIIHLNTKNGPLEDETLRKALSYAFPYQDAIDFAAGGYATQPYGLIPAGMWGHSEEVPQYSFDPEQAKQLLAEAGYADGGLELTALYTSGDEPQRKCLELYKAELQKLGVDLEIRTGPWSSIWEQAKGEDPPQDMYPFYWWPTYVDPFDFLFSMLHSEDEPLYNLSYYNNSEVDDLIDEASALAATDKEAASELYVKAQQIAMDDAVVIPMLDMQHVAVVRKSFDGYYNNPAYQFVVLFYDCSRGQ